MNSVIEMQDTTIVITASIRPMGTQLMWLNLHPSFVSLKYTFVFPYTVLVGFVDLLPTDS